MLALHHSVPPSATGQRRQAARPVNHRPGTRGLLNMGFFPGAQLATCMNQSHLCKLRRHLSPLSAGLHSRHVAHVCNFLAARSQYKNTTACCKSPCSRTYQGWILCKSTTAGDVDLTKKQHIGPGICCCIAAAVGQSWCVTGAVR